MAPPYHPPAPPATDSVRRRWKGMRWALFTACVHCGGMHHCYGKSRDRMVCFDCFAEDGTSVRLGRRGQTGRRSGYTYTKRRPKDGMIILVRQMREEGKVVGAIADELGLSEKTVRNYLAESRRSRKRAARPLPEPERIPRKEEAGEIPILVSGGVG
jgi:hypothetical protein